MPSTKTIAFLGASTGVGLSTLRSSLSAGHQCVALCRNPAKLSAVQSPNLRVVEGNAHDIESVSKLVLASEGKFVDEIISTIGGKYIFSKLTLDDVNVCEMGMRTLLQAISNLRAQGVAGEPHIIMCSTTGMSKFGRDIPLLMVPMYHVLLKVPHEDKRKAEDLLVESGEAFTIVRASLLTDGESDTVIRTGIEDPKSGVEVLTLGYTISREDAGRWMAENLVHKVDPKHLNKTLTITY
jgi:nucleoside-diphosphate-sugar epimerase